MAVVHLDDLDVPFRPQLRRRLANQQSEQRDAQRGVARLQHGDLCGGRVDHLVMARRQARGADQDGPARRARRLQMLGQSAGDREIDQHVRALGQRLAVALGVDPARVGRADILDHVGDRAPHATQAAVYADGGHRVGTGVSPA